ncbi:hypothetical protein BDY21DRAFT_352894 [Lineolata rhizophorae]|uniref:Uncharacterized protein n=1 Tax=Lineolata rhizophorae TaxID=578093 RepID=A0A6A6NRT8_9PEZI|nr:hypothetical protein BDY21DRAFT_352894 [Lineolata rhizophorae]
MRAVTARRLFKWAGSVFRAVAWRRWKGEWPQKGAPVRRGCMLPYLLAHDSAPALPDVPIYALVSSASRVPNEGPRPCPLFNCSTAIRCENHFGARGALCLMSASSDRHVCVGPEPRAGLQDPGGDELPLPARDLRRGLQYIWVLPHEPKRRGGRHWSRGGGR